MKTAIMQELKVLVWVFRRWTLATVSFHLSCWNMREFHAYLLLHRDKQVEQNLPPSQYTVRETLLAVARCMNNFLVFITGSSIIAIRPLSSCCSRHQGQEGQGMDNFASSAEPMHHHAKLASTSSVSSADMQWHSN